MQSKNENETETEKEKFSGILVQGPKNKKEEIHNLEKCIKGIIGGLTRDPDFRLNIFNFQFLLFHFFKFVSFPAFKSI
jgi:hypothetical protein